MSKIKVIVKNKTTLEIQELAKPGDIIDLEELTTIDLSYLEALINDEKDKIYKRKLETELAHLNERHHDEIEKLKLEQDIKEKEKEKTLLKSKDEEILKLKEDILRLTNNLESIKASNEESLSSKLDAQKLSLSMEYLEKINKLKAEITTLQNQINMLKSLEEGRIREVELNEKTKYQELLAKRIEALTAELREKDEQINTLQRQKASLNVKQTGEDLESWCNNEILLHLSLGLSNCTWEKDNQVVREEGEEKGSKADFILKVFVNELHKEEDLLTSICLEMKDENPNSVNKRTNASYFKALDKNRCKKNCKYALLVSNLEIDKPNDLPIYKVQEYPDMYVVRPAYMMTFLNMVVSLTNRFSKLITEKAKEDILFQDKLLIIESFEKIKSTYLDKPLTSLKGKLDDLMKKNAAIRKASNEIDSIIDDITSSYIREIEEKINKFDISLNRKIIKKMED